VLPAAQQAAHQVQRVAVILPVALRVLWAARAANRAVTAVRSAAQVDKQVADRKVAPRAQAVVQRAAVVSPR
jgi:hypothetical protein